MHFIEKSIHPSISHNSSDFHRTRNHFKVKQIAKKTFY